MKKLSMLVIGALILSLCFGSNILWADFEESLGIGPKTFISDDVEVKIKRTAIGFDYQISLDKELQHSSYANAELIFLDKDGFEVQRENLFERSVEGGCTVATGHINRGIVAYRKISSVVVTYDNTVVARANNVGDMSDKEIDARIARLNQKLQAA